MSLPLLLASGQSGLNLKMLFWHVFVQGAEHCRCHFSTLSLSIAITAPKFTEAVALFASRTPREQPSEIPSIFATFPRSGKGMLAGSFHCCTGRDAGRNLHHDPWLPDVCTATPGVTTGAPRVAPAKRQAVGVMLWFDALKQVVVPSSKLVYKSLNYSYSKSPIKPFH